MAARTDDGALRYVTETVQASGLWGTRQQISNTAGLATADPGVVTFTRNGRPTTRAACCVQSRGNPRMFVRTLVRGPRPRHRGTADNDDLFAVVNLPALPG